MRILLTIMAWVFYVTSVAAKTDVKEITTKGGIKVWLVEEPSIPFIALEVAFKGGASLDAKDKAENTMNFAIQASKILNEKIKKIADNLGHQSSMDASKTLSSDVENHMNRFSDKLGRITAEVSKLQTDGDQQAVQFAGLGIKTFGELTAWSELNLASKGCGLIVDVHTVLEHIMTSMEGDRTMLSRMAQLNKLSIETLADGVAITSFENKMPCFFHVPGAISYIKMPLTLIILRPMRHGQHQARDSRIP